MSLVGGQRQDQLVACLSPDSPARPLTGSLLSLSPSSGPHPQQPFPPAFLRDQVRWRVSRPPTHLPGRNLGNRGEGSRYHGCLLLYVWIHRGWFILFHGDLCVGGCLRGKALEALPCYRERALEGSDSPSIPGPGQLLSGQAGFHTGSAQGKSINQCPHSGFTAAAHVHPRTGPLSLSRPLEGLLGFWGCHLK